MLPQKGFSDILTFLGARFFWLDKSPVLGRPAGPKEMSMLLVSALTNGVSADAFCRLRKADGPETERWRSSAR